MASSHGKNDSDPAQSTPNTVPLPSSSTHRASVLPTNLQQATTNLADLAISPERPKRANLPQSLFGLQNLAKGNAAPDEGRDGGSVQEGTNEESETPKEGAYENWLAAQRAKNTYAAFQQAVVGLKPAVKSKQVEVVDLTVSDEEEGSDDDIVFIPLVRKSVKEEKTPAIVEPPASPIPEIAQRAQETPMEIDQPFNEILEIIAPPPTFANETPAAAAADVEATQIAAVESLAKALRQPSSSPLESLTESQQRRSLSPVRTNSDRSTISLSSATKGIAIIVEMGMEQDGSDDIGAIPHGKNRRKQFIIESDSESDIDDPTISLDDPPLASTSRISPATIAPDRRRMARKSAAVISSKNRVSISGTEGAVQVAVEEMEVVVVAKGKEREEEEVHPDPVLSEEEFKIAYDKYIATQFWRDPAKRSITGPRLPSEFDFETQNAIIRSRRNMQLQTGSVTISQPMDTAVYQGLIAEANARDFSPCSVTLTPPPNRHPPFSPPFEVVYTNRLVYEDDLLPVQPTGCACEGPCSDEPDSKCACRAIQIRWSTTSSGEGAGERSGKQGFAYKDGRMNVEHDDPIRECNFLCGCTEDCPNRVVGRKGSADAVVDIFWTGKAGWGVRLGEHSRFVEKGTPLGVYAGELLSTAQAEVRNPTYTEIGRTYLYQLDHWSLKELFGEEYDAEFEIDAFSFGNFTRFLNHRCIPNVVVRSVYIDEGNLKRPLFVLVTSQDVYPLDELTISYYGHDNPSLAPHERIGKYQRRANKARKLAHNSVRCFCGEILCRGVMFKVVRSQEGSDEE